jgi:hypothetical protein
MRRFPCEGQNLPEMLEDAVLMLLVICQMADGPATLAGGAIRVVFDVSAYGPPPGQAKPYPGP